MRRTLCYNNWSPNEHLHKAEGERKRAYHLHLALDHVRTTQALTKRTQRVDFVWLAKTGQYFTSYNFPEKTETVLPGEFFWVLQIHFLFKTIFALVAFLNYFVHNWWIICNLAFQSTNLCCVNHFLFFFFPQVINQVKPHLCIVDPASQWNLKCAV